MDKEGLFEGRGVIEWDNGYKYEGEFLYGKYHGIG